jgi:hypothetical protein
VFEVAGEEMIDPLTALATLQSTITLVKKAAQVANDLGGLGVMIGRMFDAKSVATKAMVDAKRSGNKSNFSVAMQLENCLMQTAKLESELQLIYMQTGNIDVWNRIKARAADMDREDAHEARKEKEAAALRKKELDDVIELALLGLVFTAMLGAILYFVFSILEQCGGKC